MKQYDIALATDEGFIPGAMVTLVSVAKNARPGSRLCFHVFTENVKCESFNHLRQAILRVHPDSTVEQYACDDKLLAGLPYWTGSRMASVRIFFPYLLNKVDWCLYLDCDLIYLSSIEEHFALCDDSKYAVVTKDEGDAVCGPELNRIEQRCGVAIPRDEYFNSGVMLFNFKKCRENKMPEKLMEFFRNNADSYMPDQTALNVLFCGNTVMAPAKFNRHLPFLTVEKIRERPVLHYICGSKPWSLNYSEVATLRFWFWHAFADKFVWERKGESCRRLFTWKMRLLKKLFYWMLRSPVVGAVFSWFMNKLRLTNGAPQDWRRNQIVLSVENRAMKRELLKILNEDGR